MYDNLSRRIKGFTKVFAVVLMAVLLLAAIAGAVFLFRTGTTMGIVWGIAAVLGGLVLDVVVYYLSCIAYAAAERLELLTVQVQLQRQLLSAVQKPAAPPVEPPTVPASAAAPAPPWSNLPTPPAWRAAQTAQRAASRTAAPPPVYRHPESNTERYIPPYRPRYDAPPAGEPLRTRTSYGTATGTNEDFHYEPRR